MKYGDDNTQGEGMTLNRESR